MAFTSRTLLAALAVAAFVRRRSTLPWRIKPPLSRRKSPGGQHLRQNQRATVDWRNDSGASVVRARLRRCADR